MSPKQWFLGFAAALLCLSSTSCAAMFDGTKGDVMFTSEPPGALVKVGDQEFKTPLVARIKKSETRAVMTHPEFPGQEIQLEWKREFQAGFLLLDILFTPGWGLVGCLVDGGTGAWYKQPPQVSYAFASSQASPTIVTATRTEEPVGASSEASARASAAPSP